MEISDAAYVFHDLRGRTFHPKVYFARGVNKASSLIGSHNLTRGGAVENYEAGFVVDLNLSEADDRSLTGDITAYVESLIADTGCCVRLGAASLAAVLSDPSLKVGDEDLRRGGAMVTAPSESDSVTEDLAPGAASPFKRGTVPLRTAPVVRGAPASPLNESKTVVGPFSGVRAVGPFIGHAVKRWFKKLDQANAQLPNPGTNYTGHLSLTQAGHPIAHTQYFRDEFFGTVSWRPGRTSTGAPTELADVEFEIVIHGASVGREVLTVEHRPALEAGQGNRATLLHWGHRLLDYLRANNHVDDYVSLEALSDGSFRLVIDSAPSGPFGK